MTVALLTAVAVVVIAEPLMTLVHRWVFHGPLWCWHRSHHEFPSAKAIVKNDLIWVGYFLLTGAAFVLGLSFGLHVLTGIGAGSTLYGMGYIFAHDGVAHGRFRVPGLIKKSALFRRLTQVHHFHHRGGVEGPGGAPFGVYSAPVELQLHLNSGFEPRYKPCVPQAAR